ncbi:MAG: hypothetical protein NZ736_03480 [Candidatus Poseidoniaceae archaeon]|nr:hypothetical protein [Candidatus Poseidoniaceae archaeon]
MRGKTIVAILLVAMLLTPVQAGDVSALQSEPEDDPKQPCEGNTTLYVFHDGMNNAWSHFNSTDEDSTEENETREDKDNGVIDIKYRFMMKPTLDKRLNMTVGGEIRGNFNIYYEGDNANGGDGSCNNDCDWLNITVFKGAAEIHRHTEQPWVAGNWKNVVFSYSIPEEHAIWDSVNDNPIVEVTMKVKGDYQESNIIFASGDEAAFGMKLGADGSVEFPIDDSSWDDDFQAGIEEIPAEESPGFTLVVASAAIAMAVFINAKKPEEDE